MTKKNEDYGGFFKLGLSPANFLKKVEMGEIPMDELMLLRFLTNFRDVIRFEDAENILRRLIKGHSLVFNGGHLLALMSYEKNRGLDYRIKLFWRLADSFKLKPESTYFLAFLDTKMTVQEVTSILFVAEDGFRERFGEEVFYNTHWLKLLIQKMPNIFSSYKLVEENLPYFLAKSGGKLGYRTVSTLAAVLGLGLEEVISWVRLRFPVDENFESDLEQMGEANQLKETFKKLSQIKDFPILLDEVMKVDKEKFGTPLIRFLRDVAPSLEEFMEALIKIDLNLVGLTTLDGVFHDFFLKEKNLSPERVNHFLKIISETFGKNQLEDALLSALQKTKDLKDVENILRSNIATGSELPQKISIQLFNVLVFTFLKEKITTVEFTRIYEYYMRISGGEKALESNPFFLVAKLINLFNYNQKSEAKKLILSMAQMPGLKAKKKYTGAHEWFVETVRKNLEIGDPVREIILKMSEEHIKERSHTANLKTIKKEVSAIGGEKKQPKPMAKMVSEVYEDPKRLPVNSNAAQVFRKSSK